MFSMELKTIKPLNNIKTSVYDMNEYDNELDDGRSVISDICEILADTEKIIFYVSGFGDESWPVDCRFDLPIIIEQLPEIVSKINNKDYNFKLDFYEQGIEREIIFIDDAEVVNLECISRNGWVPEPSRIEIKKENISTIFQKFYEDFILFSTVLCKNLVSHHLFKEWMVIK
jgi:hypothetical protein